MFSATILPQKYSLKEKILQNLMNKFGMAIKWAILEDDLLTVKQCFFLREKSCFSELSFC